METPGLPPLTKHKMAKILNMPRVCPFFFPHPTGMSSPAKGKSLTRLFRAALYNRELSLV